MKEKSIKESSKGIAACLKPCLFNFPNKWNNNRVLEDESMGLTTVTAVTGMRSCFAREWQLFQGVLRGWCVNLPFTTGVFSQTPWKGGNWALKEFLFTSQLLFTDAGYRGFFLEQPEGSLLLKDESDLGSCYWLLITFRYNWNPSQCSPRRVLLLLLWPRLLASYIPHPGCLLVLLT